MLGEQNTSTGRTTITKACQYLDGTTGQCRLIQSLQEVSQIDAVAAQIPVKELQPGQAGLGIDLRSNDPRMTRRFMCNVADSFPRQLQCPPNNGTLRTRK